MRELLSRRALAQMGHPNSPDEIICSELVLQASHTKFLSANRIVFVISNGLCIIQLSGVKRISVAGFSVTEGELLKLEAQKAQSE